MRLIESPNNSVRKQECAAGSRRVSVCTRNPLFTIKVSAESDVVKKQAGLRTGRIPANTTKTVSRSEPNLTNSAFKTILFCLQIV